MNTWVELYLPLIFFNFGGVFLIQWLTGKIILIFGGSELGSPEKHILMLLYL